MFWSIGYQSDKNNIWKYFHKTLHIPVYSLQAGHVPVKVLLEDKKIVSPHTDYL